MKLDLALEGVALLYMFSTIFGGVAHVLLAKSSTRWMWLVGAVAFLVGGHMARSESGIHDYFGLITILCCAVTIGTVLQFEERPPSPPSKIATNDRRTQMPRRSDFMQE